MLEEESSLSEFVVSYKYVPLETSAECLMGWIDKIIVRQGTIYVLELRDHGRLFMFNIEGKYLRTIGRVGKGPGEYVGIRDIEVSKDNSKIYILTATDNILVYNNYGSFEGKLQLYNLPESVSLWDFLITPDAFVFNITSRSGNSFLATNLGGIFSSIDQAVPSKAYVSNQLNGGFHNPTFVKRICDTIFKICPNGHLEPYMHLDFGENALTIDEWEKAPPSSNGWSKEISHPYAQFNSFYDLKDFFVLELSFHKNDTEAGYFLLGTHDGKHIITGSQRHFNDYLDHALVEPLATLPDSNMIITSVYPHLLYEALPEYHKNKNKRFHIIDSLCSITREDDNPIIVFYRLDINK